MLQMQEFEKILNETLEKVDFNEFEKIECYLTVLQATPKLSKQDITSLNEIYKRLKELEKLKNLYKKILKHAKKELKSLVKKPANTEQETEIQTLRQIIEKSKEAIESDTQHRIDVMYRGVRSISNRHHARILNIFNTSVYCLLAFVYLGCAISMPYRENHIVYIIPLIIFGIIGMTYVFVYLKFYFRHNLYSKKVKWIKYLTWFSIWLLIYTVALVGFFYITKVESEILIGLSSVLSLSLIIAANLLDFFSSTRFFDEKEMPLFTMVIVAIVAFVVSRLLENEIINYFINIFLAIASIILIFLIIKKFIVEMPNVSKPISIFNLIILILLTLGICILTIYGFFWNKQENASQDLFNSIMGVFAGIAGGALTLAGVAWTIKKSDEDKRTDEIKRFRPVFNLMNDKKYESILIPFNELVSNDQFSFKKIEGELYYIKVFAIRNTSFSEFYLRGLRINKKEIRFNDEYYITRDKTYRIDFQYKHFYFSGKIDEIDLEVEDLLGNKYYAKLGFEIQPITSEILEEMSTRKFGSHITKTSTGLKRTEKITCITINKVGKALMEV